jgi:hypothetical protein
LTRESREVTSVLERSNGHALTEISSRSAHELHPRLGLVSAKVKSPAPLERTDGRSCLVLDYDLAFA